MNLVVSIFRSSLFLLGLTNAAFAVNDLPGLPPTMHDSIGVFQNGVWTLDMDGSRSLSAADTTHSFGVAGDQPVVYAGVTECVWRGSPPVFADIGVYRGADTWFETRDDLDWQPADAANTFTFGREGLAVIGRSNMVMLFDFAYPGTWFIDDNLNRRWGLGDRSINNFGQAGDRPVVGTWAAGGQPSIGVFYEGEWWVDTNGNESWDAGDENFIFGSSGDLPVTVRFSDGVDRIGVFQNGVWSMDFNGNRVWDGPAGGDAEWEFGSPGDIPVVARGAWKAWECPIIN